MRSFRNNNKRSRYRNNGDRNFKRNGESQSFTNSSNFQRKSPGRNNQNASKLIEKYNDLAREALSNGDKILYENYLQHSDHFSRILTSQENQRILSESAIDTNVSNQLKVENENKEVEETSKE